MVFFLCLHVEVYMMSANWKILMFFKNCLNKTQKSLFEGCSTILLDFFDQGRF